MLRWIDNRVNNTPPDPDFHIHMYISLCGATVLGEIYKYWLEFRGIVSHYKTWGLKSFIVGHTTQSHRLLPQNVKAAPTVGKNLKKLMRSIETFQRTPSSVFCYCNRVRTLCFCPGLWSSSPSQRLSGSPAVGTTGLRPPCFESRSPPSATGSHCSTQNRHP